MSLDQSIEAIPAHTQHSPEHLQIHFRPRLVASLRLRGASEEMADDVASGILADCLLESEGNLLRKFQGSDGLENWLMRVAINRLITIQRRENRSMPLVGDFEDELSSDNPESLESPLRELVNRALRQAMGALPAGMRVLLWLRYAHGIAQNRLSICWRCHPTKLSRMLAAAREEVRIRTLAEVRRVEPGLMLQWEDVVAVCTRTDLLSP